MACCCAAFSLAHFALAGVFKMSLNCNSRNHSSLTMITVRSEFFFTGVSTSCSDI